MTAPRTSRATFLRLPHPHPRRRRPRARPVAARRTLQWRRRRRQRDRRALSRPRPTRQPRRAAADRQRVEVRRPRGRVGTVITTISPSCTTAPTPLASAARRPARGRAGGCDAEQASLSAASRVVAGGAGLAFATAPDRTRSEPRHGAVPTAPIVRPAACGARCLHRELERAGAERRRAHRTQRRWDALRCAGHVRDRGACRATRAAAKAVRRARLARAERIVPSPAVAGRP